MDCIVDSLVSTNLTSGVNDSSLDRYEVRPVWLYQARAHRLDGLRVPRAGKRGVLPGWLVPVSLDGAILEENLT